MVDIKSVNITNGQSIEQNLAVSQQGNVITTKLSQNNAITKLGISPDQISNTTRDGQNLVIHLKDGSQIVIQDFFLQPNPQLALQQGDLLWNMQVAETATGLETNYLALSSLSDLAPVTSAGSAFSIPTWGMAIAGAAGLGGVIAALSSGGGSSKSNDEKDITPPKTGTFGLNDYQDTGIKATDFVSQDKDFDLTLTGQEAGSTVIYQVSKDGGKTWVNTDAKQSNLTDGTYQFRAVVSDAAGNTATTAVQTIVVDTTAPKAGVISLTAYEDTGVKTDDFVSQDRNFDLTLTGQEAGSTVIYQVSKDGGKTWVNTDAKQSNLTDGSYQFRAVVSDAAGNTATTSVQTIVVDTTAPKAGVISLTAYEDTGVKTDDFVSQDRNFDLTLTGQEAGSTVIYQVSKDGGKTWVNTDAKQSNLTDGSYQFRAVVSDVAGNVSTTSIQKVTVISDEDTTAPKAGVISLTAYEDTGAKADDFVSQDRSFDLTLTGQEAGSTVIYQVSKDGGKTWVNTDAKQSNLTDGSYQFRAVVSDAAGNTATTTVQTIVVDTTAPKAGVISLTAYEDTGAKADDFVSQDRNFDLTLTGQEAGSTVIYQVSKDGGKTWVDTDAKQTDLVDGVYQFKAVVSDAAGNTQSTNIQKVTVDTTVPKAGVISLTAYEDTGAKADDFVSQDRSFDLTLTGQEAGSTVIYQVSKDGGKTWVDTEAKQADLVDGVYQFKAVVTDLAGNTQSTNIQKVTVDTTVPKAGVISLTAYEDTGAKADDFISQDRSFDLTLTGQEAGSSVIYQVSKDGGKTWVNTDAKQTDLVDGVYQFKAVVTDLAGNTQSTNIQKVTVDTTVPKAGVISLTAYEDTGAKADDFVSQDRSFDLTLTGQEAGSSVIYQVSKDGGKTWVDTDAKQTDLVDGVYQFKAVVTDLAGNTQSTNIQKVTVDTTVPKAGVISLTAYEDTGAKADDFVSQDRSFDLTLTGQEAGSSVIYQVSKDGGKTWVDTDAKQTDLVDGVYQFKAVVTDLAGNTQSTNIQKVTVDTTVPKAGVISLTAYEDTGTKADDFVSQDRSFDLTLTGQEAGSSVIYQVSKDGGKTWVDTDAKQTDLVDGVYQFKAVVTDLAGNTQSTNIQKVTVDTTVPKAGVISLTAYEDTGAKADDFVSQDRSFDLTLTGQEAGSSVIYQVSKDGGKTWVDTDAKQTDLVDGTYQFKAVVTDLAGNTATTAVQTVVVDNLIQISANTVADLSVSSDNVIRLQEPSKITDFVLSLKDLPSDLDVSTSVIQTEVLGKNYTFTYHAGTNEWVAQIPTADLWVDAPSAQLIVNLSFQDVAGNIQTQQITHEYFIDPQPDLPGITKAIANDQDGTTIEGFAYAGSTIEIFDSNSVLIATVGTDAAGNFEAHLPAGYQNQDLTLTATYNGYTSPPAVLSVVEVPILTVQHMSETGEITGLITSGSELIIYDTTGKVIETIQVTENSSAKLAQTGTVEFKAQLGNAIPEGETVVIVAKKNEISGYENAVLADYTAPQIDGQIEFDQYGTSISGKILDASNVSIDIYDANDQFLGHAATLVDGTFTVQLIAQVNEAEVLKVKLTDKNNNITETTIVAPNVAYPPQVTLVGKDNTIQGFAEDLSVVIVKDAHGNELGRMSVGDDDHSSVSAFSLVANRALIEGETLYLSIIDQHGVTSEDELVLVDWTAPEPATDLLFDQEGSVLTGTAEPWATIILQDEFGNVINTGSSNTVDEQGHFTIYTDLHDAQKINVIVVDANKNESVAASIIAPDYAKEPYIYKIAQDGTISGSAEALSTVIITDINGVEVATGVATNYGDFELVSKRPLIDGEELFAEITDIRGNQSQKSSAIVDYTAPPAITDLVLDPNGIDFTGIAEIGSWIEVLDKDNNVVGYGYTSYNSEQVEGNFRDYLLNGQELKFVVIDGAGNRSTEVIAHAHNDVIAPEPILDIVLDENGLNFTAKAEANSLVKVLDTNKQVIGSGEADKNGEVIGSFSNYYLNGQSLTFIVVDRAGNESVATHKSALIDAVAPEVATHLEFVEEGSVLKGIAEPNAMIKVLDSSGQLVDIWSNVVGADGGFIVSLGKHYLHNEEFKVVVVDYAGNESNPVTIKAPLDDVAPEALKDIVLNENGLNFTATAEANATIKVYDKDGIEIGQGSADEAGQVTGSFGQVYLDGEELHFVVLDRAENPSAETVINALLDNIAPLAATDLNLTEGYYGSILTGKAEPNATIKVYDQEGNELSVHWGTSSTINADGVFNLEFYNYLLKAQELSIVVVDAAGNISPEAKIIAPLDDIAPEALKDIVLNEDGRNFTATAEANTTIKVYDENGIEIGLGSTNETGQATGYFYNVYLNEEKLHFVVLDRAENSSAETVINALLDNIAPSAATDLNLTEGYYGSILTGKAEPNTTIKVYDQEGNELSVRWGSYNVNADGTFNLEFYDYLLKAQELSIVVVDAAGNTSPEAKIIAPLDDVAPEALKDIVLNENGQEFTATAEANSTIKVYDKDGIEIGQGFTNETGQVAGSLNQVYLHGEELHFVVLDRAKNPSPETVVTALVDDVPPNKVEQLVLDTENNIISGQSEENILIEVLDPYNQLVHSVNTNSDGDFSSYFYFNLSKYQGEDLRVVAVDRAGNRSEEAVVNIPLVENGLAAATDVKINELGNTITGNAEVGKSIEVIDSSTGQVIAQSYINEAAFTVELNGYYLQGQSLHVRVYDGSQYSQVTEIAAPLDNVAPVVQDFNISEDGYITATTEKNSTLKIVDQDGDVLNLWLQADENGQINQYIGQVVLPSEVLTITAIDLAKNESEAVTYIVQASTQAPAAPSNIVLTENGLTLTGQADASTQIVVYEKNGNMVASGYSGEYGQFAIQFNQPYISGQVLRVVAYNNYPSNYTEITAPVDTIAPEAPSDLAIDLEQQFQYITGQTEAFAKVEAFNDKGESLGYTAQADVDGKFSLYVAGLSGSGYWNGETIQVQVTDANGNKSPMTSVTAPIDHLAPSVATELKLNEGTLTGISEPWSSIRIEYISGEHTQNTYTVIADQEGNFLLGLSANVVDVTFTVIDRAGNESQAITLATAELAENYSKTPVVKEIQVDNTTGQFTGDATPNSQIIVRDSDGNQIGDGRSNAQGQITGSLGGYTALDQEVHFVAISSANVESTQYTLSVSYVYVHPVPNAVTDLSLDETGYLIGNAEAQREIRVEDGQGNVIALVSNENDGSFKIDLGGYQGIVNVIAAHTEYGESVAVSLDTNDFVLMPTHEAESRAQDDIFVGYLNESDNVIFKVLEESTATGGNGLDTWTNFHVGDTSNDTAADKINLSELFVDDTATWNDLNSVLDHILVEFDEANNNTVISIDRDGSGTNYEMTQLLILENVNTTLDDLLNNQQIVY
ncbi:Ig-like domain-containing protein [Acinetobacter sichuanensis]|uniref:Ig-like domain-containing protein n=4 Tax=Acinetobacter sichuanensis TaxID=2136183 RepID=A0ABV7BBQ2_9GAMM